MTAEERFGPLLAEEQSEQQKILTTRPIITPEQVERLPGWAQPFGRGAREMTSPAQLALMLATAGLGPSVAAAAKGLGGVVGKVIPAVTAPIVRGPLAARLGAEAVVGTLAGTAAMETARLAENAPAPVRIGAPLLAGLAGGIGAVGAIQGARAAAPAVARGAKTYAKTAIETGGAAAGMRTPTMTTAARLRYRGGGPIPGESGLPVAFEEIKKAEDELAAALKSRGAGRTARVAKAKEDAYAIRQYRDNLLEAELPPEEWQRYQDLQQELYAWQQDLSAINETRPVAAPKFGTTERADWDAMRREKGIAPGARAKRKAGIQSRIDDAQRQIDDIEAGLTLPEAPVAPAQPGPAIQSGMGIGEKPSQGGLFENLRGEADKIPLADREQMALRQQRAAEIVRGQQQMPITQPVAPVPLRSTSFEGQVTESALSSPLRMEAKRPTTPVGAEAQAPELPGQQSRIGTAPTGVTAAGQGVPPPPPGAAVPDPERGFITHTSESPMGSPILRKLFDDEPITYSPITNAATLEKASRIVNADHVTARAKLMAETPFNPDTMVDDMAEGFVLMRKAANEGNVVELRDLSKRIAEKYTSVAQTLQLASTIDKLSPEGLFIYTQRILTAAVEKGRGTGVTSRLRAATNKIKVKAATADATADVTKAKQKVVQANQTAQTTADVAAKVATPQNTRRAKDLEYLMDDAVREVQAKLTPAERQAITKTKAILKQSVAEMDEATANSFLDRAAALNELDGEARVKALMDLVDEVRQLPQVQSGFAAGQVLKQSPQLLKQQAADLEQLIDRTARNVFQQLNSVDRLAMARVKAILRRTDVELPSGMAENFLAEAHALRGLPLAERPAALNRLVEKIKKFDPVEKELARTKVIADAEARARQAARQAAQDLETLIDASSRKITKGVTPADRLAVGQAKSVLRRFGVELPREMAKDFLVRAKTLASLPETEQAAAVKALVNEIKQFNPVKQAQDELVRLRLAAAEAKQSAKDLQYLAHQELRTSKTRLQDVAKTATRSAKATVKQSGVEMPEELAQSFLDRAKALRGITDEYDQMRAAQVLMADVHSLVPPSRIHTFMDIIGLPRIFEAAFDLSFSLRQGIIGFWSNPKGWGRMVKTGLKSFAREDVALAADRQFFARPLHKAAQEAGLDYVDRWGAISQQEETFINAWTEHVPGIRQSNRSYTVQGNKMRADNFDAQVMEWLPADIREEVFWGRKKFETLDELIKATGKTKKDFERLAQWENVKTGRGDLGKWLQSNNEWLNALFFAPRFAVSRFEVPIFAARNLATNPALRKTVAKDLAAAIVGSTAALYMVDKLPGVSVEFDPRSSDFRRIRIGALRIDIDGGFATMVRQVVQIASGTKKDTTTGAIVDVSRGRQLGQYGLSKLAPTPKFGWDVQAGESFDGPLDSPEAYARRVAELWTPLVAQDVFAATQEFGAVGVAAAPVAFLGTGLNTYGSGVNWQKDFEDYFAIPSNTQTSEKDRLKYRTDNPEVDAKLFITGEVGAPRHTANSYMEVVRLMKENGIGVKDIKSLEVKKYADGTIIVNNLRDRLAEDLGEQPMPKQSPSATPTKSVATPTPVPTPTNAMSERDKRRAILGLPPVDQPTLVGAK